MPITSYSLAIGMVGLNSGLQLKTDTWHRTMMSELQDVYHIWVFWRNSHAALYELQYNGKQTIKTRSLEYVDFCECAYFWENPHELPGNRSGI